MQEPYKNWNLSLEVIIFFREDVNKPISQVLIRLITIVKYPLYLKTINHSRSLQNKNFSNKHAQHNNTRMRQPYSHGSRRP